MTGDIVVPSPIGPSPIVPSPIGPSPIGQMLLDAGLIRTDELNRALKEQWRYGGDLGTHLVAAGDVSAYDLYTTLSHQWNAPMIDLGGAPPKLAALAALSYEQVLEQGWIPLDAQDGRVVIATTVQPGDALAAQVKAIFGEVEVLARTMTRRDLTAVVSLLYRQPLLSYAADALAELQPDRSARVSLRPWQRAVPVVVLFAIIAGVFARPAITLIAVLAIANATFSANIAFKLLASIRWPLRRVHELAWEYDLTRERRRRGLPMTSSPRIDDRDLPMYTILVPAFHEANIIGKVIENVERLDYPRTKLDVLVLMEEDDVATIEAAKAARPPEFVRLVVVPRGQPQTKPRACNYGLVFARGEYVVIYDAEDRPDPDQLRRVLADFRRGERECLAGIEKKALVCVQCALNYFNADYNLLTRMFTVEYTQWFDAMLPGLDRTGIPIPLGGTSNHFNTDMLRELGGWDPYNVTEDADLGMRAFALGYRVGINTSTTWEEACSQTGAWIKQRTRWIKGYLITAAVNFRRPLRFWRATGTRGMLCLAMLILGTPIAFMLYPLVLIMTVVSYVNVQPNALRLPHWLLDLGLLNMVVGNLSMILVSGIATWRRHGWRGGVFAIFCPVYWLMHS